MKMNTHKSGSALVTVLLTITAMAIITVLATRNSISDSRTLGNADSAAYATRVAQGGIEEGLARMTDNGSGAAIGLTGGMYGTTGSDFQLTPKRRGYTDSDCSVMSVADSRDINKDCPYYDLAVRTQVRLTDIREKFYYTAEALPVNTTVTLSVPKVVGTFGFTAPTDSLCNVEVKSYNSSGALTVPAQTLTSGTSSNSFINTTVKVELTVKSKSSATPCVALADPGLLVKPAADNEVVIDRGSTSIESVGYIGGVHHGLVMTIYKALNSSGKHTQVLSEMSGLIDENGQAR